MALNLSIPYLKQNWRHLLFETSILVKGVDATLEILASVMLFILGTGGVTSIVASLTYEELSEDPRDLIANYFLKSSKELTNGALHFGELYLLVHGLVKMILVIALLRKKIAAFPIAIVVFGLFVIYQLYRFSYSHSISMVLFSIFDIIVVILTTLEYRSMTTGKK